VALTYLQISLGGVVPCAGRSIKPAYWQAQ
jgi:hypothetical protein